MGIFKTIILILLPITQIQRPIIWMSKKLSITCVTGRNKQNSLTNSKITFLLIYSYILIC